MPKERAISASDAARALRMRRSDVAVLCQHQVIKAEVRRGRSGRPRYWIMPADLETFRREKLPRLQEIMRRIDPDAYVGDVGDVGDDKSSTHSRIAP